MLDLVAQLSAPSFNHRLLNQNGVLECARKVFGQVLTTNLLGIGCWQKDFLSWPSPHGTRYNPLTPLRSTEAFP
jgi:hypothetical protein